MGIRVRAVRQGYYNYSRRKEGEVFEIESEEHFSDYHRPLRPGVRPGWMERVPDDTPLGRPSAKTGEIVPHAFSELGAPKIQKVAKMPKTFEAAAPAPAEGKPESRRPTGSAKVI